MNRRVERTALTGASGAVLHVYLLLSLLQTLSLQGTEREQPQLAVEPFAAAPAGLCVIRH